MHLNFIDRKMKIFSDLRGSVLSPIPKFSNWELQKFYKNVILTKYENADSKTVEMLFKQHQNQND